MTRAQAFDPNSFNLSASAADHFKENLRNKISILGIRFSVEESSGCSGYTYSLDYVDKKKKKTCEELFQDMLNLDPKKRISLNTIIKSIQL